MFFGRERTSQHNKDSQDGLAVPSLPITEAMRESVLYEGQPKFKAKKSKYGVPYSDGIIRADQGGIQAQNKLKEMSKESPNFGYPTATDEERQAWYDEWDYGKTGNNLQSGRVHGGGRRGISESSGDLAGRQSEIERSDTNVNQNGFRRTGTIQEGGPEGVNRQRLSEADEKRGLRTLADEHSADRAGYFTRSFSYQPEALEREDFKQAADIAEKVGLQIYPYKYASSKVELFNGMVQDGMMFINVKADESVVAIAYHEATHQLKIVNPEAYGKIEALILSKIRNLEKIKAVYKKEVQVPYPDDVVLEEFTADMIAQALSKEGAFFSAHRLHFLLKTGWEDTIAEAGDIFNEHVGENGNAATPGQVAGFKGKKKEEVTPPSISVTEADLTRLTPRAARNMAEVIAKGLNTVLRSGRMSRSSRGAQGTYNTKTGTGNIKKSKLGSWRVMGHELGHALWYRGGFRPIKAEMASLAEMTYPGKVPKGKESKEGLAEFLVLWFTDNAKARSVAPKTTDKLNSFLDANAELAFIFDECKVIAENDLEGSSLARMSGAILKPGEKLKTVIGEEYQVEGRLKRFVFKFADMTIPVKDMYEAAVARGNKGMNPAKLMAIKGMAKEQALDMFNKGALG